MLTGSEILKQVHNENIIIHPFNINHLGPNSHDLTIGHEFKTYKSILDSNGDVMPLDLKKNNTTDTHEIDPINGIVLEPGIVYLGHTNEIVGSNKYMPYIDGRSSIGRLGIQVHLTAGKGDVGYIGQWTLEILVVRPIRIYRNIRICQIYFDTLEGIIGSLYNGKYKDSRGVIASRMFKDSEFNA